MPFDGRKIQVSELWQFTIIYPDMWTYRDSGPSMFQVF